MDYSLELHKIGQKLGLSKLGLSRNGVTISGVIAQPNTDDIISSEEIRNENVWGRITPVSWEHASFSSPPGGLPPAVEILDYSNLTQSSGITYSFWIHGENEGDLLSGNCSEGSARLIAESVRRQAANGGPIDLNVIRKDADLVEEVVA